MTISYNWLHQYLPLIIEPEKLSRILTSIGLEVESMEAYEEVKGGLKGLVIGEVLTCEKHPDADKLSLTTVNVGGAEPLQIVCGAPNVAVGQKAVVATVGTTIYPLNGEPMTMKKAKIRGVESQGMICAEDEIGLGNSHAGIMVLKADAVVGTPAADYFQLSTDTVYEIGLTPNRMDAMSHMGVARDVIAWVNFHEKKQYTVKSPFANGFKADNNTLPVKVTIENKEACERYTGVSIKGVTVKESPDWLKKRLKSIGLRPINNIVDITNFILHETGQPLHAFDYNEITGAEVIVKNCEEGTPFITLDEKERKLSAEDLMICNKETPMCIGGVFGGLKSGVTDATTNIFLESAWFHPVNIRKTSFRHNLRTDAATRFEKGVDISNTVNVLKRAALMIKELAGGEIASDVVDVYPSPKQKVQVAVKWHYLKKLSGKNYHPDAVKKILEALGFEIDKEGIDEFRVSAPFSKTDIEHPADIVEEIMRIDGLDNVEIPSSISISPAVEVNYKAEVLREKAANYVAGLGFNEIFTNSIANSAWYSEETLNTTVKMLNNLSAELNVMRPSMVETGLQSIGFNINRRNLNLRFFEFGKTYSTTAVGVYDETAHLTLYLTGNSVASWKHKPEASNLFQLKAYVEAVFQQLGVSAAANTIEANDDYAYGVSYSINKKEVAVIGSVQTKKLKAFDIKQPVFIADINWDALLKIASKAKIDYNEIPRFPAVERDLALVIAKNIAYEQIEQTVLQAKVKRLKNVSLFDVFESEKLGADKKSMALNLVFLDAEKTLTDAETDKMMSQIMTQLKKELGAEIRN
ncbi:MAG: phenylalanine--tRNA ligase subunit beta [Chitinophagaceae bacterium]|nr:phenylalanine--tRNA ligase subunit beta [Chitinophagaceae bacterium]